MLDLQGHIPMGGQAIEIRGTPTQFETATHVHGAPNCRKYRRALILKLSQMCNCKARAIQLTILSKQRSRALRFFLGGTRYNA